MRLWHKDLIPVLPRQQLLAQWRECCCIARNIHVNGMPNHLLVNKIMEYPACEFNRYAFLIYNEMHRRGYKCNWLKFTEWRKFIKIKTSDDIFDGWHNERYLIQCYYNLQEKYDCGGIPFNEWMQVAHFMDKEVGIYDDKRSRRSIGVESAYNS